MSQSYEKPLNRLLRYSPWAAAALVAICFVALVTRVAIHAGSTEGQERLASAAEIELRSEIETAAASSESRQLEPYGRRAQSGVAKSTGLEVRRTNGSTGLEVRRTGDIQRTLSEPATPNSKSHLQVHSAPRDESVPDEASPSVKRPNAKRAGNAAAALHALSQPSHRASSLDGRVHTSFFGLEAYGRRFAYVLDRSGSMGDPGNKPLNAAKQELLTSMARLGDIHQFFIIFYNEEPVVFNPGGGVRQAVFADEVTKNSARRFVERVQAHGGTRHYEALASAIALRPDVIFLLTDGEPKDDLSDEELDRLRRSNGGLAQIHVVQFAASPYDGNSLVRLARENRGQHRYTDYRDH